MAYHRNYYGSGRGHARRHLSERAELTRAFAGIDKEIEAFFLSLPWAAIERLLAVYGSRWGRAAADYARETYPKWKAGTVRMSGQTAQRLLELIPPLLPVEHRFELLKKLRLHHMPKARVSLTTTPEDWASVVPPAVETVVDKSRTYNLPAVVIEKAKWLTSDDSVAAMQLLAAIEQEEARNRVFYLEAEFQRLTVLVAEMRHARRVAHRIFLPQGTIDVIVQRPSAGLLSTLFGSLQERSRMDEKNKNAVTRLNQTTSLAKNEEPSLLNQALNDLPAEQLARVKAKAVDARLDLEVGQAQADARFMNSTRDMANTLDLVNQMDRTLKTDYDIRSQFDTASGRTDIHVKKNNNLMIMVVAIAVAVALIVFMKR